MNFIQESHIHLVKLTRLLRLARLLQKMDRYSQYTAMILTLLMLCFSLVAHWLACVWYVIAEREQIGNDIDWDIGKCVSFSLLYYMQYVLLICTIYSALIQNLRTTSMLNNKNFLCQRVRCLTKKNSLNKHIEQNRNMFDVQYYCIECIAYIIYTRNR